MRLEDVARIRARSDEFVGVLVTGIDAVVPEQYLQVLGEQYRALTPILLPAALECLETGRRLTADELDAVRRSAAAMAAAGVPVTVVLAGIASALGVFCNTMLRWSLMPSGWASTLLVARAAQVTHHIGVVYAGAWVTALLASTQVVELAPEPHGGEPTPELEPQDSAMLALVAEGRSNDQIAAATAYSTQAVRWRLARLMRRWDAGNRAALVTAAFQHGVLGTRRTCSRPRARAGSPRAEPDGS